MNQAPCMPGEVHPAYTGHRWLVDWLDGGTPLASDHVRIPIPDPITLPRPDTHVMTRRKAWGPAPYVGRPFVYQWYVGEDELGRMVGGCTTWIRYLEGEAEYMIRTGDMSRENWPLTRPADGEPGWPTRVVP